jgi:hypothetical protein
MTGIGRIGAAIRQGVLPAVLLAAAATGLTGCDSFKKAIGMEKTSPDEFAVESRAPLTIPPDFDLRPPQPGAGRPQEVSPSDKAQTVLNNATPGEPGKQAPGTLHYAGGNQIDPNSQIPDQSLSAKLLQTTDSGGDIAVEKRETTVLEGIH